MQRINAIDPQAATGTAKILLDGGSWNRRHDPNPDGCLLPTSRGVIS